MPDFTMESFYHCVTAEHFQIIIEGSRGKKYTVVYGNNHRSNYQYDWSCTCEAYKFGKGKYCKHIDEAKKLHCGWMQFNEGGTPLDVNGEKHCPKCGAGVNSQRWAV